MPYQKSQIISSWLLERDSEFTAPDMNPAEHLWDMLEQKIHIIHVS